MAKVMQRNGMVTGGCRFSVAPRVTAPGAARECVRQVCAGLPGRTADNAVLVAGELDPQHPPFAIDRRCRPDDG